MTWRDQLRPMCQIVGVRSDVGGYHRRTTQDCREDLLWRVQRLSVGDMMRVIPDLCEYLGRDSSWFVVWVQTEVKWRRRGPHLLLLLRSRSWKKDLPHDLVREIIMWL